MADLAPVPDATPAAPSAAPDAPQAPQSSDSLENMNEAQTLEWKMTGKVPATSSVTTPPAGSSPATPVQDPAAPTGAPAQPAGSDPAASPHVDAAGRIPQLLSDRAKERERAERAERRLAELERATFQPPPADARSAASSAAPADGRPDPEKFTYGTSDPEYLEALTDYKVAATLANERRQAGIREEGQRVISSFEAKAEAARAKYPDFDAVAMLAPTEIPQGSAIDLFVLEDPAGADILYHLQQPQNAVERRRILKLAPLDQLKTLVRLGDRLTGAPAAARSTTAPDPPVVLSSRATPGDPVERALAADDTGAYIREMNRRDLARLKR